MSSDIQGNRLLVISDSPMYKEGDRYIAFEPVVREMEALTPLFKEIVWLGCRVDSKMYAMRSPREELLIRIVAMPSVLKKYNALRMLALYPVFICYVLRYAFNATHVHTRGPSHPALLGILLSPFFGKKAYWHKYAGNWIGEKLAATYRLQRTLLKMGGRSNIKVTVNGAWKHVPKHILSFENPSFSESELMQALEKASQKDFSGKLNILFVGNLTKAKGILSLLSAATSGNLSRRFEHIYIAGDGDLYNDVASRVAANTGMPKIHLLGHRDRASLNEIYSSCHFVILPSESEGFPKVVAEGAAFGCIPVVSNVSSISQYIVHSGNGYLLNNNSTDEIVAVLNTAANSASLKSISAKAQHMATSFTYERFVNRLSKEVFGFEQ